MTRALLMCMPDIYQSWNPTHIVGPWLGGASIAGNCSKHDVYVADLVLKRNDVRRGIKEAICRTTPEEVGLSAMTFQYPTAVRVAKHIKENYPGIPISLGGYHATSMREQIASSEEGQVFDYIFAGESEHTYNQHLNKEPPEKISGLSFKSDGKWIHNPRHLAICKELGLSSVVPPYRDSRIWGGYHFHSRPFDTAEFSRGCNYACKFCSMRVMMPKASFHAYDLDRVIEDLRIARSRGTRSIFFVDDNPAMDPELFEMFLQKIIGEGLDDIYYSGMVSTESMSDPKITKLMRKAGWDFVFLGVENIHQPNLENMRKSSSKEVAERAINNLYESGITTLAGIIVGNPDDTEEIIRENFRWFHNRPVDSVMPQFLTPYPGTEIRRELLAEGLVVNRGGMPHENDYGGWTTYNGEFAHCRTKNGLMPEDLEAIIHEEFINLMRYKIRQLPRLSFTKNNLHHLLRWVVMETLPRSFRFVRNIGKNNFERTRIERERKIAMNRFNI